MYSAVNVGSITGVTGAVTPPEVPVPLPSSVPPEAGVSVVFVVESITFPFSSVVTLVTVVEPSSFTVVVVSTV